MLINFIKLIDDERLIEIMRRPISRRNFSAECNESFFFSVFLFGFFFFLGVNEGDREIET